MYLSLLPCLVLSSILRDVSSALDQDCDFPNAVYTIPGDVGFMGIFNLHTGDNCSTEHGPEFETLQNVIQTIQRLNRLGNTVAGGVTIGLHVYDACNTTTKAEKAIVNALFDMECSHTYSLGLLTTSQVSTSLAPIISNLHLVSVILSNEPPLDLPLLFNASFSFLQSIQMTTVHVAILPDLATVASFSELATMYRLCVNNPMSYRHVADSKDKIQPLHSDSAAAVLVGTLEQYRTHVAYVTSVVRNVLFIPTDLKGHFDRDYFTALKNGTFVVSPYLYEQETVEQEIFGHDDSEHPFIQKLNEKYTFKIDMKFVHNSLKIYRNIEQFKVKYKTDCGEKLFKICEDLKPLRSEITHVRESKRDITQDFINSFQVDNTETSINGIYVYRMFNNEKEDNIAQSTAQLPVGEHHERIEDAKKKLLLEINNTNFENMGKRDLILSSIHIVTSSEAYETDLLDFERNEDRKDQVENMEDLLSDDPTLNHADHEKNEPEVNDETRSDEVDIKNVTDLESSKSESEIISGSSASPIENDTENKMKDILIDIIHQYSERDGINLTESRSKIGGYIDKEIHELESIFSNETELSLSNSESPKVDTDDLKSYILANRNNYLLEKILQLKQNGNNCSNALADSEHNIDTNHSRSARSVKESKDKHLESLGKFTYVNNTWIVVLNEDEELREGSEKYLCKIINEDNYTDNETTLSPGKDCSSCYNFREIYQLIELNKQDIEASKKRILDIVFKVEFKTNSFTVVIISLSVMGVIACIVILGFIVYRIIQQDSLEGNPTITLLLVISVLYNYFVIAPFIVEVDPNIEYFDYYSHLLCYIRLISVITSFNFIFSLMLTRCLMLSFSDFDGVLMSHINGYVQSSFCFFITIIQILFLANLFLIKYVFNVEIKCDIIQGNYILMLSYNIILLILLLLTIPFIYKCKRNYFEGAYMTITIVSIAVAWFIWIHLYIDSNYNESFLILGIFLTSTLVLIIIFIPRTYHMIIHIVRQNITSILPTLSSQYMSGEFHNVYRSNQALYDIVNDSENKHLGEMNPYYVSRNESKLRPYLINRTGLQSVQESYLNLAPSRCEGEQTSIYNEDITGRLNSSLGVHNIRSPARSHRQAPSFQCQVKSPSIQSRAESPSQMEDEYGTSQYDQGASHCEPSRYEGTSRCETSRFDTPSTMTRF